MQHEDRRFAMDPRFRFYCMNYLMRHEALSESSFFIKRSSLNTKSISDIDHLIRSDEKVMKSIYVVSEKICFFLDFPKSGSAKLSEMMQEMYS